MFGDFFSNQRVEFLVAIPVLESNYATGCLQSEVWAIVASKIAPAVYNILPKEL